MSPPPAPQPVSVTGGAGGIVARTEEMVALARRFGAASTETLHSAWDLHGYALEPGFVASALFDPGGYATYEAELLFALDGPGGLTWAGLQSGALDGELRLAAAAYERADQLYTGRHDDAVGVLRAPAALVAAAAKLARTGDPIAAAEAGVAADPELADDLVDWLGVPAFLAAAARELPDGHGEARALGTDRTPIAQTPPRTLTDVVGELERRCDDEAHHGAIDVRILTLPDGSRRAIVDVSGTKSWTPLPTPDVTSLPTNGRALVGVDTAYEQGVLAAMRKAGVRPSDDVMIVGHSQGGMVAVNAARDAVASGRFNVTHVITAGSPIGLTVGALPSRVQVLALESSKDVVPHLDGRANPDLPNVTTATSNRGTGTITGDHDFTDAYLPVAADVQASGNASILHFLAGAGGYLRATHVETKAYQVVRVY
jgi:hypothetical protein